MITEGRRLSAAAVFVRYEGCAVDKSGNAEVLPLRQAQGQDDNLNINDRQLKTDDNLCGTT